MTNIKKLVNEAFSLLNQRDHKKAHSIFKILLKTDPNNSDYLLAAGTNNIYLEKIYDGIELINRSLTINPKQYFGFINLGIAKNKLGDFLGALEAFYNAIILEPSNAYSYFMAGNCLQELNRFSDSLIEYKKAVQIKSDFVDAYYNMGNAYQNLYKFKDAIEQYEKVIHLNLNYVDAYYNMGNAYLGLQQYKEAIKQYKKAIQIKSDYVDAYCNMGNAYQKMYCDEDALSAYESTLKLNHSNPRIYHALSNLYLSKKMFEEGWSFFESRWDVPELGGKRIQSKKPIYTHTSIQNKKVLLWSEQGIGDQIIYLTMLKDMLETGNEIIVSIDPRLINLYQRSFEKITFISNQSYLSEDQYDYHLPLGSLGSLFRRNLDTFKMQPVKNIRADPGITLEFTNKLKKARLFCGISWESLNKEFGKEKSLDLECLLPILNLPHLQFLNLQYGDKKNEIDLINQNHNLNIKYINDIDLFHEIDKLASLIDMCDFVITTSNVTAHLAGSLGKKTFLILANYKIWYWQDIDRKSLWYPSVKIFNKNELNDLVAELK